MALILDRYDAVYGIGRYGSARYGIVTPIYTVSGQRLTSSIGTVKVRVTEKSEAVRATLRLGTPTYKAAANKTLAYKRLNVTLGTVVKKAAANTNAAPLRIQSGTSDSRYTAKANKVLESVSVTVSLGTISAKSINRVPVNGFTLSISCGIVEVTLRTYVTGYRLSSSVGTVKVNLKKVISSVRSTMAVKTVTTKAKANLTPLPLRSSLSLGTPKENLVTRIIGLRVTSTVHAATTKAKANKVVASTHMTSGTKYGTATGVVFNFSAFSANYSPRRTLYIPQAA